MSKPRAMETTLHQPGLTEARQAAPPKKASLNPSAAAFVSASSSSEEEDAFESPKVRNRVEVDSNLQMQTSEQGGRPPRVPSPIGDGEGGLPGNAHQYGHPRGWESPQVRRLPIGVAAAPLDRPWHTHLPPWSGGARDAGCPPS
jgi:hypothetical protein